MTRSRLFRRGMTAFDVVLVAGVALVPLLAWRGIRLVEFGLIPLLVAPLLWRRMAPDRNDWLAVALFAQYAGLVALNVAVYPRIPGASGDAGEKIGLYLGAALLLLLMVLRLRVTLDVGRVWRVVGPAAVLGSVALLGWEHLTTPPPDNCRVGSLSKFLLFPPVWLTVLALAGYHQWDRQPGRERLLRHLTLALVIVATVAFSGARGVLIAQVVTIPVLALLLGRGEPLRRRLRIVAVLGAVSLAGFAGGIALDLRAGCQFADRLVAIVDTAIRGGEADDLAEQAFAERLGDGPGAASVPSGDGEGAVPPAPELDAEAALVGGVYIRVVLWQDALEAIRAAPLLGHGHLNEDALVVGDFPHYHQQYLSWMVWGGPLMLLSGVVMLFAPLATFGVRRSRDGAVLALAMVGPLAVGFLAATNLLHTVMVLGYVMTLALMHALARQEVRTAEHADGGARDRFGYMARL